MIRINENLTKITRMRSIFSTRILDTPSIVFTILDEQEKRLMEAQRSFGEYITPDHF
jgi:phosphoenolpyruvate carboxykinase (GTP)